MHVVALDRAQPPCAPAVARLVGQAISAHRETLARVPEPDVEQRLALLRSLVRERPALATILGPQDHGVVPDGPAAAFVEEIDRGEGGLGG